MYKNHVLAIALFVLALLVVPVAAQTNTDTPAPAQDTSAEATPETTATLAPVAVDHVRIAYLAPDSSPVLTVYMNGQSSDVQLLAPPTVTGWFDLPSSASLSLVDVQADPNTPVIGPINPGRRWSTLVVATTEDGGYQAFTINENLAAIPAGCARVTVLHTIPGAPSFDLNVDNGTMLASGVGMGAAAPAGTPVPCGTATDTSVNANGAVDCVAITPMTSTTAETTPSPEETPDTTGTTSTTTASAGQSLGDCGSTFDVVAGTYNLTLDAVGTTGSPMTTASGTEFLENTYYLLAVFGTQDNLQTFLSSVPGSDLKNMLGSTTASTPMPETTLEVTTTATP